MRRRRGRPAVLATRCMDGPVIQQAVDSRAGAAASGSRDVLRTVEAVAAAGGAAGRHDLLEPDRALRRRRVRPDLAAAGGRGLITPDLIPDEAGAVARGRRRARPRPGLPGRAVARPTSGSRSTAAACRGFVYAASTMGVTGARGQRRRRRAGRWSPACRRAHRRCRSCVGLGRLARGEQAAEVAGVRRRRDRRLGVRRAAMLGRAGAPTGVRAPVARTSPPASGARGCAA